MTPSKQKNQIIHTHACLIHTFISSMFFGPPGPDCKPHMYRMRHVLPQPVSPIITTGMLHLKYNYSDIKGSINRQKFFANSLNSDRSQLQKTPFLSMLYRLFHFSCHKNIPGSVSYNLLKYFTLPKAHVDGQNFLQVVCGEFI